MLSERVLPVPALIISGYLGSGKTTLVGHLLREAQEEGARLAIISNEFGDTGIDRALLDAGEAGYVELDGGCVCCRLSDALGETLEAILTEVRPDRLVLETSGVALPADVLLSFWRPPISELVSEEVVVVVVDAEHLLRTEDLEETFVEQVETADLFLLNKCDLISAEELRECEDRLAALSGGQPVIRAVYAVVSPSLLFPPDPQGARVVRRDEDAERPPHSHEQFSTRELAFTAGVEESEVLAVVAAEDAIRAKGFVRCAAGVRVVQGVGARIELSDPGFEVPENLLGRVVVIRRVVGGSG